MHLLALHASIGNSINPVVHSHKEVVAIVHFLVIDGESGEKKLLGNFSGMDMSPPPPSFASVALKFMVGKLTGILISGSFTK